MSLICKKIFQHLLVCKRNRRGFTLIELMVAISIFTLLSSFTIINYRVNEKVRALKNQAQELVSGIQKIQNMALTGETVNSEVPIIYKFSLADCVDNCVYKLSAVISPTEETIISQTALKAVNINITPLASGGIVAEFAPPRGKMLLHAQNDPTETYADTAIEIKNSDVAVCIRLNAISGRIDYISGACQ